MTRRPSTLVLAVGLVLAGCSDDDGAEPIADPVADVTTTPVTTAPTTSSPSTAAATTPPPTIRPAAPATTPPPTTERATTPSAPTSTEPPATAPPATEPDLSPSDASPSDAYPEQPAGVPYPTVEWAAGDLPAGADRAAIDAAVDAAFGAPDAPARVRSVVVVHGGRIVYERYHPLDGPDVAFNSFSVAKSFTSAMIGLLVADGLLALDEPAAVPEWQSPGDPRQAITLRHLLQMSSGLEWAEDYSADSLVLQMLNASDAAAIVARQPLEAEPGELFEYSTGTTALLAGIAADALGGCEAMMQYVNERLLDPIGITTDTLLTDGNGCWLGGLGADMTTRDFARFGLLFLRGGSWDGRQILPVSWVDESRRPAPANPSYGLQWWLSADGESFSAEGLFGQRIVIVPDADLVVATNTTQGGDSVTMVDAILTALGVVG